MAVQVQAAMPTDATEAGVIEAARKRQRLRRIRAAYSGLAGLVLAGGMTAGLLHGSRHPQQPHRRVGIEELLRSSRLAPRISPGLEGGSYGWAVFVGDGGSCCTLPTVERDGARIWIGATAFTTSAVTWEAAPALLSARVHEIRLGERTASFTNLASLPYEMQLAWISFPRRGQRIFQEGGPPLLAVGAHGEALGYMREEGSREARRPGIWWQGEQPAKAGSCRMRVTGIAGARPQWGHIAASIEPYPRKILGRAFFSCASTEYYLHNWPLETAILLDAQRPGAPPAAIPGMHAVAADPGVYDAPGAFNGELTARRDGNAWLVVAGGSGLAQRLEVLRHLSATIPHTKR